MESSGRAALPPPSCSYKRPPTHQTKLTASGEEEGGEGGTQFVHGRSRTTIDPRIPTMPGRSTSAFHQPGRHCLHQARCAVRCSASRMKGELHPSKNRSYDGLRHLVPTFLLMDDSANELLCFLVRPRQRQQWILLCN